MCLLKHVWWQNRNVALSDNMICLYCGCSLIAGGSGTYLAIRVFTVDMILVQHQMYLAHKILHDTS